MLSIAMLVGAGVHGAMVRKVWVGSYSGDPFWQEGQATPTTNAAVNAYLEHTSTAYRNAVGRVPA